MRGIPSRTPVAGAGWACALSAAALLIACGCADEIAPDASPPPTPAERPRTTVPSLRHDELTLQRRAEIRARAQRGPAEVLLVGDSITQAWLQAGSAVYARAFAGTTVANLGIGGDRTENVLARLGGDLEGFDPALVVLLIGTNNLGRDAPADVVAGIGAIVAEIATLRPNAEVLLLALLPRGFEAESEERRAVDAVNLLLAAAAREWPVRWLDVGGAITERDGRLLETIAPDGLHLTEDGYARWSAAMQPTIDALLAQADEG